MKQICATIIAASLCMQALLGQERDHTHTKPDSPIVDPRSGSHELRDSLLAVGGGALAGILLGRMLAGKPNPHKFLSENGPQHPDVFGMSTLSVLGFVKGGWPMVLDYEVRQPGIYLLTVSVEGIDPFFYLLDGAQSGRHLMMIPRLPDRFGLQGSVATCSLRALSSAPGEAKPIYFRIFGWGCGPRAVGSVAIDQLRFTPPVVRQKLKQTALYGFHSHADFEKVTAEFERVGLIGGNIVAVLDDKQNVDQAVRRGTEVANKSWNPKKAKPGQHMLQIRAWYSLSHGGDWVIAWSPQIVQVEE